MRASLALLLALASGTRPHDAVRPALTAIAQAVAQPVAVEFRIFAGTDEITATTQVRIMPTGTRDAPTAVSEAKRLAATIPPGIYDVQALRLRREGIIAIKWAERLVVMHYPDEAGRHLEVINFEEGYGALQIRSRKDELTSYEVAVFPAGARETPENAIGGEGYYLYVLRAGRYDIRVRHPDRDREDRWIPDVEVPANRTRMKIIDGS